MRVNLPATLHEYPFPQGETLVSTTDLKGRILYCNPTFIEVSGYDKQELLGQPHNLIRHPDMPEEAFRDMWATIEKGVPWSAPVKNRRKDGSFYWVMANVTPLMEGDTPLGYMSVRTEATREQIQNAERLYSTMRDEKAAGKAVHVLRGGRFVTMNLAGRLAALARPGPAAKMVVLQSLVVLAALGAAVAGGASLSMGAVLAGLGVLALAVGSAVYLHTVTIAPLRQMLLWANRMAAGDLTQKITVTRDDTVGFL